MNLSRRSFIFGGAASLVGAGAVLGGCNHKVGGQAVNAGEAIKVAMVDYFDKFDFVGAANPTIVSIGWHILEGLYDINPYTNETYPALADDSPVKIDDTTYEITLRENAKYSNDAKVMAGDIINSINVAKKKESISGYLDFIRSVESAGNNKIKLNLNYPVGDVLEQRLSLAKITPASASDVDKTTTPVGTGPYMVTEMNGSIGGEIKFTPNANYNGGLAIPENPMVWTIPADAEARAGAIKNDAVHICEDYPLDKIKEIGESGKSVEYIPGFECANFFFHTTNQVFSHRELRQAVYYAVNTERLINDKMAGHAGLVTCVLAETNKDYYPASTIYTYNPDKAKELIAASGIANPQINFVADKNCWAYKFKDYVIADLEAVGFKCNVIDAEFRWSDVGEKLKNIDYDICMSTYERSLHGANADFLLNNMYYTDTFMDKRTGYADTPGNRLGEIKSLLEDALGASGNELQDIYNQVFDIVAEEAVFYPFLRRDQVTAFDKTKVNGFRGLPTGGMYCLETTLR